MNNIDEILEKYYEKENFYLENNNLKKNTFRYKTNFVKFKNNRDDQLGQFLIDAKLLSNLTCEEDINIKNPRLRNRCVQYHYLEKAELKAYIGYRTKIRENIKPKNPQFSFLVIYLMEIVNDVYTSDFDKKFYLVKDVELLTKPIKRVRELFREAYEILYMQYPNEITLEEFRNKYNVLNIFEDYSSDKGVFDNLKFIYEQSITDEKYTIIDKFLIENSYKEIIEKAIDKKMSLFLFGKEILLSDEFFQVYYQKSVYTINKLYSNFPLNKELNFYNEKGDYISLKNSILQKMLKPSYNIAIVELFFNLLKETFRKKLENNFEEKNKLSNSSYFARRLVIDNPKSRDEMQELVNEWIINNSYCQNAYNKTIQQLVYDKRKVYFNIDIDDIKNVRNDSAKIQDKIIIDSEIEEIGYQEENEEIDPKLYFNKIKREKLEKSIDLSEPTNEGASDNIYSNFLDSLDEAERLFFNFILIGLPQDAETLASNCGMMVSLLIEKINMKAVEFIDDVVIENNEIVEDYKEELMMAF